MEIKFQIISRQRHSPSLPAVHVFGEAGGYIGRSGKCQWVLPDRSRKISRTHALIFFEQDAFYLEDLSRNGVFLAPGMTSIGKGTPHKLVHGQEITLGGYTIMVRLSDDPTRYAPSAEETDEDLLLRVQQPTSLDPLKGMEEEETTVARQRMGDFDDLLGQRPVAAAVTREHIDPRFSTLQPVVAVADTQQPIPEDWNRDPDDEEHPPDRLTAQPPPVERPRPQAVAEKVRIPETDAFFKALGFAAPETPDERERILLLAAELLLSAVEGMTKALQNRAECKNELRLPSHTTNLALRNNPLKFSPTAEDALAALLKPAKKGILPGPLAMREGFNDLHSHHLGLVAGARAAVRAAFDKLSPRAVQQRLDFNGSIRLYRSARLWKTFVRLHQACLDDPESLSMLYLHDFTRAYELQAHALNPTATPTSKGERS